MSNTICKDKKDVIHKYLGRLISQAEKSTRKKRYEVALEALSAYCNIQYQVNQVYTDKKAENLIVEIANESLQISDDYSPKSSTVLFYDGFGLDLRGWTASYVRALIKKGYELVYVTNKRCKDSIPHILGEMAGSSGKSIFIDMNSGQLKWINELNEVFKTYRPKAAFFYTIPNDVAAASVFNAYRGKVMRYQIDLTDHAFWIGVNAADYFLESRVPGASNAIFERGISKEKIINIDCCLYINRDVDNRPLPFDIGNEKYVFSGGSLYKTLGDKELLFYMVVENILKANSEIKFLYAGSGDDTEMKKLQDKFPERVFCIEERPDFYRLIENSIFMWNTYPMFGGLMMRFAANAGRVPLTLKHGKDHEGLLFDQDKLGIEFDTYEEIIKEANLLIRDVDYRKNKEKKLSHAVLSEEDFARNIRNIIENQTSEFQFNEVPHLNTDEFRKTYLERIEDPDSFVSVYVINRRTWTLIPRFLDLLVVRIKNKISRRDKKR